MKKKKISTKNDPLKKLMPSGKKDQSFFEQVYILVRQIPRGRVSTYGMIAELLGAKSSARMVGWAMNGAHTVHPPVPAHRVVNRNGMLSGRAHFETPSKMEELLYAEGIEVKNNQVVNFENLLYNFPETEEQF